jgi:hypothetical protein
MQIGKPKLTEESKWTTIMWFREPIVLLGMHIFYVYLY